MSSSPPEELARFFGAVPPESTAGPGSDDRPSASPAPSFEPNYNVTPSSDIYGVYHDGTTRRLDTFHWGLVPGGAKDLSVGNRMINARAESLLSRAAFRRALTHRRCLIPADGFYEWAKVPGRRAKQPYYLCSRRGGPLAFAGLWAVWRGPAGRDADEDDGSPFVRSCTIITTAANETVAPLHDRMPAILDAADWDAWLDPANDDTDALSRLLVPAPADLLSAYPVSPDVGNVRNQGPHLIEPLPARGPAGAAGQTIQPSLLDPVE